MSRATAQTRAGLAAIRFPPRSGVAGVAMGPDEAVRFRQPDA